MHDLLRGAGRLPGRCGAVDPSAAVVWLIAVATAVAAALWAGADAVAEARHAVRGLAEEEVRAQGSSYPSMIHDKVYRLLPHAGVFGQCTPDERPCEPATLTTACHPGTSIRIQMAL